MLKSQLSEYLYNLSDVEKKELWYQLGTEAFDGVADILTELKKELKNELTKSLMGIIIKMEEQ